MDLHSSIRFVRLTLLVFVTVMVSAGSIEAQPQHASSRDIDPAWYEDAELTDLFFIDAENGWVTGEHGLLLRTTDSGETWEQIETNISCRLESICFVDDFTGWIAGGYHFPHSDRSAGVILKTIDGGKTWILNRQLELPRIYQIQFANADSGWAVGDGSQMFPSGVFLTQDGGRSWSSQSTSSIGHWRQGAWLKNGQLLLDRNGRLYQSDGRVAQTTPVLANKDFCPKTFGQAGRNVIWAAGNSGWIARSLNAGTNWQLSDAEIRGQLKSFDLKTTFAVGDRCWIAGSPGTHVLHTNDAGNTWSAYPTHVTTPLRKLHFVNGNHGWAIGSLGTILRTTDGGKSWQVQRGGSQQASILSFFHDPKTVPFELFSVACGGEGRHATMQLVRSGDVEKTGDSPQVDRLREALARIGCSATEELFVGPTELANHTLRKRLACQIRSWRPSLIVTQEVNPETASQFELEFQQELIEAIKLAADSDAMSQHFAVDSLPAWRVTRLVQTAVDSPRSIGSQITGQYIAALGRTADDHAMLSRQLVSTEFQLPPEKFLFANVGSGSPVVFSSGGITTGIPVTTGENARSKAKRATGSIGALRFLTRKQEHLNQLVKIPTNTAQQQRLWRTQLKTICASLPAETAGNTLFQLAWQYRDAGQIEMTVKTLRFMLDQDLKHPLQATAQTWLLQYHASAETQHFENQVRMATSRQGDVAPVSYQQGSEPSIDGLQDLTGSQRLSSQERATNQGSDPRIVRSSAGDSLPNELPESNISFHTATRQAEQIAASIRQTSATLFVQPDIQFPIAAFYRKQPGTDEKKSSQQTIRRFTEVDSRWSLPARAETWLANQASGVSPIPIARSVAAPNPPRLDGKLAEAFWQANVRPPFTVQLRNEQTAEPHTKVRFAHDQRFLYIGIECDKLQGEEYADDPRARPRDPNLNGQDRVTINIDIDRDYVSSYQFQVDYRGWVSESCFDDASWNPEWFVASFQDESSWTIEAAIPISELATQLPIGVDPWAIRLNRHAATLEGDSVWQSEQATTSEWSDMGLLQFDR